MINLEIKTDQIHSFDEVFNRSADLAKKLGVEDHVFWKLPSASRHGTGNVPANNRYESTDVEGLSYVMPIIWKSDRDFETQLRDFDGAALHGFEIVSDDVNYWPVENGRIIGSGQYRYMGIAVLPQWSGGLSDDRALKEPGETWGRLVDLGFDLIMTDRPEQLINYLENRGLR